MNTDLSEHRSTKNQNTGPSPTAFVARPRASPRGRRRAAAELRVREPPRESPFFLTLPHAPLPAPLSPPPLFFFFSFSFLFLVRTPLQENSCRLLSFQSSSRFFFLFSSFFVFTEEERSREREALGRMEPVSESVGKKKRESQERKREREWREKEREIERGVNSSA